MNPSQVTVGNIAGSAMSAIDVATACGHLPARAKQVDMVALTLISVIAYLALALSLRRYARARFRSCLDARSSHAFVRLRFVELATHVAAIMTASGVLAFGVYALATRHGGTAMDLQRAVERVRSVRQIFTEPGSMWSLSGLGGARGRPCYRHRAAIAHPVGRRQLHSCALGRYTWRPS